MPDETTGFTGEGWGTDRDLASIPGGSPEAPGTWTCTRLQMIAALREVEPVVNLSNGGGDLLARGPALSPADLADAILSHLPVAEAPEPPVVVPAQPGGRLW